MGPFRHPRAVFFYNLRVAERPGQPAPLSLGRVSLHVCWASGAACSFSCLPPACRPLLRVGRKNNLVGLPLLPGLPLRAGPDAPAC